MRRSSPAPGNFALSLRLEGALRIAHQNPTDRNLFAGVPRLRPTGNGDTVQVLWWNGERWGAPGPLGIATMALDRALDYVANEPNFWILG